MLLGNKLQKPSLGSALSSLPHKLLSSHVHSLRVSLPCKVMITAVAVVCEVSAAATDFDVLQAEEVK